MHQLFSPCDRPDVCELTDCRLARIERKINLILEGTLAMSTTLAQLDAEITVLAGIDTTLAAAVSKAIADLQAKASGSGIDFTPELTNLQNIATALGNVQTAATQADPGAPASTLATTTTTLSASETTAAVGDNVVLSVVVDESPDGPAPTGSVILSDGESVIDTLSLDSTGAGSFTVLAIAAGSHSYTAAYGGDGANAPSASSPVVVVAS
jgi:Bacterial Ig-like domain (group 3)